MPVCSLEKSPPCKPFKVFDGVIVRWKWHTQKSPAVFELVTAGDGGDREVLSGENCFQKLLPKESQLGQLARSSPRTASF
ncbi:MAG: hypothetical protein F6J89_33540 [Symploca sp. SIO1C4]|uniref:Uncharacterized protein n=1 Tax=Symploca sp. SIO1C4 TaxID=2607765 RepID=A0A6B3NGW3_9CYAN|nr:hypothetical protein [Symploca sp. SIO1C4]